MDGESYLRKLVEDRLRDVALRPPAGAAGTMPFHLQEIHGAAWALVGAGALPAERAASLLRELHRLVVDRGLVEEVHVSIQAEAVVGELLRVGTAESPPELSTILDRPPPPRLVRVLPVVQDVGLIDDEVLTLGSIEIWTVAICVSYSLPSRHLERSNMRSAMVHWEAWDDVGTHYRGGGGGGSGGEVFRGHTWMTPAPSDDAQILTVVSHLGVGGTPEVGRLAVPLHPQTQ